MTTHCLIADDSRMSRMMIKKIISQAHPDWSIVEAEDGQAAVDQANEHEFQVVLLDFNMPVMNGGQAAEHIRKLYPQAKIAFLTANVQDSIKNLAINLGIDFIAKPISEIKINDYIG